MANKDGCDEFCTVETQRGFSCGPGATPNLPDVCTCSCQCQTEVPAAVRQHLCTCQDDQKAYCGIDANGVKTATGKKCCSTPVSRRFGQVSPR